MSHFCGLVILTPEYAKTHGMDDSLAKYDENLEYPEYRRDDVSDYDKVRFLEHYALDNGDNKRTSEQVREWQKKFAAYLRGKKGFMTQKAYKEEFKDTREGFTMKAYFNYLVWNNKQKYADFFKKELRDLFDSFGDLYAKNGEDWNDNCWRKDENGVWAEYTTYNPNSKWDWYSVGNRWDNSIKTKAGEYTNICKFGEIDFEPFPEEAYEDGTNWLGKPIKKLKEGYEWHYTKDELPFCLVIDGVWYEKGEMGWWGIVSNEKGDSEWDGEATELLSKIPEDATVYNVDFHI